MKELFRDTAFGHLVRLVTRNRYLRYQEEEDSTIFTRFIDAKKSGYLAHHGDTSPPESDDVSLEGLDNQPQSYNSRMGSANINQASGVKVHPEKGRDVHLVCVVLESQK